MLHALCHLFSPVTPAPQDCDLIKVTKWPEVSSSLSRPQSGLDEVPFYRALLRGCEPSFERLVTSLQRMFAGIQASLLTTRQS